MVSINRPCGVVVSAHAEARAGIGDGVQDVQQIAHRSCQPIEPRDHEHVAGLDGAEELAQLLPFALRPSDLLPIDFGAAATCSSAICPARSWPFVLTRAIRCHAQLRW